MNRYYLLFILFSSWLFSWAQLSDSLVKQNDLVFKSPYEKNKFLNSSEANQYLDIFLMSYGNKQVYNSEQALQKIEKCVKEIEEKTVGKTETKKLKFIYTYVHERFFIEYEEHNSFSDIFQKGYYNCVSSTALYAIIFTKLQIPFRIMEKPQHVFIIAYPETHKVYIETTSPTKGYIQFNEIYMTGFVEYLYNSRIISKEQFESQPSSKLFEQYYYSSTGISLRALASVQLVNYALYNMEDKNFQPALEDVKKAYYLEKIQRNHHILKHLLVYDVANNNFNDTLLVKNFGILCRINQANNKDVTDQFIEDVFVRMKDHQLIDRSDYTKFTRSYQLIHSTITDSTLKNRIAFVYHYELARLGLMNVAQGKDVHQHLKEAYRINSGHADLQNMIISELGYKIELHTEADKIYKLSESYKQDFSFLKTNAWFNSFRSNCILQLAYQSFLMGDLTKGEKYLETFENMAKADSSFQAKEVFVEKAYSEGASAYYKKGNVKRCRQLLKNGLIYAPDSFGLMMRLNQS